MFLPFVRKKLRDIFKKPSTIQRTFLCRFLSIGEEKMSPLSKKRGHHDLRILRFERIASTAAVRTRGDFGNIPSPLFLIKYMSNFAEGGLAFIRIFDYNLSWLFISIWRQDRHRSVAYELFVRFTDCRKVGCLDPSHTDFMQRGTHTGSNAGRYILGHSRECYKTNRRENQKRKVCKETHRK